MAGPFSPIEQQNIQNYRLVQTELPQSEAEAGGLARAAVAAVAGVQEVRKAAKLEDYKQQIDSVYGGLNTYRRYQGRGKYAGEPGSATSKATAQQRMSGDIDEVVGGLELYRNASEQELQELRDAAASGNATAAGKLEEFRAIARAVDQGKLPSDAAAIRLRAITKAAINEAPEFANAFRTEARNALGFYPEAEAMRRLMREPTKSTRQTEMDKQQEEFEALVQRAQFALPNITREQAMSLVRRRIRMEFEADEAQYQLTIGEMNDRNVAAHANLAGSAIMTDTMALIAEQVQQNGGVYDENAALGIMLTQVQQQRAKALSGVVDPQVAGRINTNFNQVQENLTKLIQTMSARERATSALDTMTSVAATGFALDHSELLPWMSIKNADAVFDVANLSARLANSPKLMQAFGLSGVEAGMASGQRAVEGLPVEFRNSMLNMFQGNPPTSERDAQLRSWGNQQLIGEQGVSSEIKQQALSDLIDTSGAFTAVTALDDAKVVRQVLNDQNLTTQAANLLNTKLESQAAKLRLERDSVPGVKVLVRDGKLELSGRPIGLEGSAGAGGGGMADYFNLKRTVQQMNRIAEVNNRYANGSTKFDKYDVSQAIGDPRKEDFGDDLTERRVLGAAPEGYKDGVYKLPDGSYVRVEEGNVYAY